MADEAVRALSKSEIKTHWRDVIELDVRDPLLKKHIEGFLNYFEGHAFKYYEMNPQTGKTTIQEISGQNIIGSMAAEKKIYDESGFSKTLLERDFMKNGKFVIAQHDRLWDGKPQNGATTMQTFISGKDFPLKIEIGTDYLKGALYTDVDGKNRPVTVDGVIAHELAHFAFANPDEQFAGGFEGIIATAMGGYQPNNSHQVHFNRNGNGGYVTLYDKVGKSRAVLEFNDRSSPAASGASPNLDLKVGPTLVASTAKPPSLHP